MSKIVKVGDSEYLDVQDYSRFGTYPRDALDNVVGAAVGYPAHWSAFTISQKSAQVVTVSPGLYLDGEIVYEREDEEDLNLTLYFPLAESDEKWVAIIPRGETVDINENRSFETSEDPEISEPVSISTPVIEARKITYVIQQGVGAPAPAIKPTIAETDACLAFVRVTTAGVQEIVPGDKWRAKTLYEVEGRVTSLEIQTAQLFEETASLRTDLASVAAQIQNIPDPRLVEQIIRDVSWHNQALNLPDEARNYFFDQALVKDFWDFTKGGYFRITEGIRFQYVAQYDQTLRLLDYDDPKISIWDDKLVMPAYDEVARITSAEGTGKKDVANVVHTVTIATQHTVAHERVRYGETINVCENTAGWGVLGNVRYGETFQANGETWQSLGQDGSAWNQTATAQNGHAGYNVARVSYETYYSTYTTYHTEEYGLSGAIHGQTFLSSQVMVVTSIDLNFTKVGDTGDVTLSLCKITPSGTPDFKSVLAHVTKPVASLAVGWNKFTFRPTLLDQGERYGWFISTTGNHQLMTNSGNAYTGGSLFICSDGIWAQGSTTEDFTFRVNAAKFRTNRVVMQFESLSLTGGMTEIEMIYKKWTPAATRLVWEVKAQGDDEWVVMDDREDNPLANLPPLVQLRLTMIGTPDVAPMIYLDTYARAVSGRMRLDMVAISQLQTFGFGTDAAQVVVNMDAYSAAAHTCTPKLMLADDTIVTADTIVATIDPMKPSRTKFVANFTLPTDTPSARVRLEATTNSVINVPFGQDVQLNAF
ncbi:MAG: hypothetical protein H6887_14970 [Hoeflea sp.]|nr:hypothetical protein [Hoeflea sp.]